ncbi:hypothetical protein BDW60DRAFT_217715 [Aspergillus nidulans var. acristatus]
MVEGVRVLQWCSGNANVCAQFITQNNNTTAMSTDDTFPLYDLRVEVIVPEGKRILCGAKKGDYFTLKGEMMFLPGGQGIRVDYCVSGSADHGAQAFRYYGCAVDMRGVKTAGC